MGGQWRVRGRRGCRTKHDKPLGLLDTVLVGLGVTEGLPLGLLGLLDLVLGAVTDEDGLTTPLDDNLFRNGSDTGLHRVNEPEDYGSGIWNIRSCPRGWHRDQSQP